jgi:heme exporter protein A
MLEARGLTLWRGMNCLFRDLSFQVSGGAGLLLRGANGSGKTTLLRVLCGLTQAESGSVDWRGERIDVNRQTCGRQIAYLGHRTGLKADLTARQNLSFESQLRTGAAAVWQEWVEPLAIEACLDLEIRYLSAGQKRRVALARHLSSATSLWLMDEPFTNLDDMGRRFLEQRLSQHLEAGGALVLAAHHELELQGNALETLKMEQSV